MLRKILWKRYNLNSIWLYLDIEFITQNFLSFDIMYVQKIYLIFLPQISTCIVLLTCVLILLECFLMNEDRLVLYS